jgi:hypothetical protein
MVGDGAAATAKAGCRAIGGASPESTLSDIKAAADSPAGREKSGNTASEKRPANCDSNRSSSADASAMSGLSNGGRFMTPMITEHP